MNRTTGVWVALGLWTAAGCATDVQTSESADEARVLGDVSLGLVLPDGSDVTTVRYVVTRAGADVRSGDMAVNTDGRASVAISGLEAGNGYHVKLSATRGTGSPCAGEADFVVVESQTTNVNVVLQCDDLSDAEGNITIRGSFNLCPKAGALTASPAILSVGSTAQLTFSASDRDGDALRYTWTAVDGTFSASSAASTGYTCASAGPKTLTVSFTDGAARGCTKSATVQVTCTAASIDAGIDSGVDSGAGDAGVTSSQSSYVVPTLTGVQTKAILTVGDSPNLKPDGVTPYRMVGIPDGLGVYDNNDGTFTLLANQELGTTVGIARAHGGTGAFVSRWTLRKSDLRVLKGEDLIQTVKLWDKTTSAYVTASNFAFARFCSADLAPSSAWYDSASNTGFNGRLFLNGEESGVEGRALAHGMDGVTYELPRLGHQSWENLVASPASGATTVVIGMDDTSPNGQVMVYVGTKTNTGLSIDKAGLTNGTLYAVKVPGVAVESNAAPIATQRFELASLGDATNQTGAQLETAMAAAGVTGFMRPEDGAFDPSKPNDFYFATTASVTTNSRLWRLRFDDIQDPTQGGVIENMLDGSEGQKMFDNLTIDPRGHVILQEDVGNDPRLGKIWRYTIAKDELVELAQHDPNRFVSGAPNFLTQDEESSGLIDASAILGAGWFLFDVQAHYSIPGELAEGGQFNALYDPGSVN